MSKHTQEYEIMRDGRAFLRTPSISSARPREAAPDLLEALKDVTELYVSLVNSGDAGFWNPEEQKEIQAARAAIAKATGEKA